MYPKALRLSSVLTLKAKASSLFSVLLVGGISSVTGCASSKPSGHATPAPSPTSPTRGSPQGVPADSAPAAGAKASGHSEPPSGWDKLKVYFGSLHSHTGYSDGAGTPRQAFALAKQTGLDFFAVTEHNHRPESGEKPRTIATDKSLYKGTPEALVEVATELTKPGSFWALYGQEWSLIPLGNHINVFEIDEVIDDQVVDNGNVPQLLDFLSARSRGNKHLLQLNHPASLDDAAIEYGRDDYPSQEEWVAALDPYAQLIEVLNGPALSEGVAQRPDVMEEDYLHYLNLGFHLAPTANQDNHQPNWGTLSDARTGVASTQLSRDELLSSLFGRHTFASEDKNLTVLLWVGGALMGSEIPCPRTSSVSVQMLVFDPDEPKAQYEIELFGDLAPGGEPASVVERIVTEQLTSPAEIARFPTPETPGYFFAKVWQKGSGEVDRLWTAPVWMACPRDR